MDIDLTLTRARAEHLDLTKPVLIRYAHDGVTDEAPATITRWVDIGERVGITFSLDEDYAFLRKVEDAWLDPLLLMMHSRDGQEPPERNRFYPTADGWGVLPD